MSTKTKQRISQPTILDSLLLQDKKAEPFLKALAKHSMLSILGSLYRKRGADKQMPYTIFVPRTLKLPKSEEEAKQYLRSHIFKNKYDIPIVQKLCEKHQTESITLSSLSGYKIEVSCSDIDSMKLLNKPIECSNGTYYFVDGLFEQVNENTFTRIINNKQSLPSIADILYSLDSNSKLFMKSCAKYNLCSMLCTKYYDKKIKSFTAFTLLVPQKLKLPKENVYDFLRSHFVKRRFNLDRITKYCSKLSMDGIVTLKLGTMTKKTFEINCSNFELNDGKKTFILDSTNLHNAQNGCVYVIPGAINI